MRALLGLVILIAALSAVVWIVSKRRSARRVEMPSVMLSDVPRVFAALTSTRNGHFAVFLFGVAGQPPAPMDALNLQFSIEEGRPGIDWVLLAPPNLESQARFVEFFERKGRTVLRREANQVSYLRVEGEHLPELAQALLRSEFKVLTDQKMDLITAGFVWAG